MSYSLDDFIYDAGKCVGKVGEKTSAAVEYSKKRMEKFQLKGQLKEKLLDLGKLCYDMHEKNEDYTGSMKKLISEINGLEKRIKETDEILKTPKVCTLCGTKNSGDSDYCSKCGEKLSRN